MVRGGIERYLKTYPEGGYWRGKNYLFDRRLEQVAELAKPAQAAAYFLRALGRGGNRGDKHSPKAPRRDRDRAGGAPPAAPAAGATASRGGPDVR